MGTKFIIRDSKIWGRVHRETGCLFKKGARQKYTPREEGCGHTPRKEEWLKLKARQKYMSKEECEHPERGAAVKR